jgi:hypothetical protein
LDIHPFFDVAAVAYAGVVVQDIDAPVRAENGIGEGL